MKNNKNNKKKNTLIYNLVFIAVVSSVLIFLTMSPPVTTPGLPIDDNHKKFQNMKKKEAEKSCLDCHGEGEIQPLPADHPPKYRCLLCHRRTPNKG